MRNCIDQRVDKLLSYVNLGVDMWEAAGRLLVELKAEDPLCFEEIIAEHKDVSLEMLQTLEDIGNKKLHPRTLLLPSRIAASVAAMPYDAQEYVVRGQPVPVSAGREGNHSFKTIHRMSVRDAHSAFSPNGIVPHEKQVFNGPRTEKDLGLYELCSENQIVFFRPLKGKAPNIKPITIMLSGKPRVLRVYEAIASQP